MTTPKCPLCGKPLKLSTIENKGQLNFFACYKCNYQLRMSPRKDFALEYAKNFISLFPPIMRVQVGERVKVDSYGDTLFTIESKDIENFKLYFKETDIGFPDCCYAEDISEWPWELEQEGGTEQ